METLKIIITSLLVVTGIFGDTFHKDTRKITFVGWSVISLALLLGMVEMI